MPAESDRYVVDTSAMGQGNLSGQCYLAQHYQDKRDVLGDYLRNKSQVNVANDRFPNFQLLIPFPLETLL